MCSPNVFPMYGFHQPWKPVLGHAPSHLHVPGVDEEHSSQFFAGFVDRVQLGGVEVQTLAAGTDLEAWHAKLLNLNYNLGPIQFLQKKTIFVAYRSFYLLFCQSGRLHRKSTKANKSGWIPVTVFECVYGSMGEWAVSNSDFCANCHMSALVWLV